MLHAALQALCQHQVEPCFFHQSSAIEVLMLLWLLVLQVPHGQSCEQHFGNCH